MQDFLQESAVYLHKLFARTCKYLTLWNAICFSWPPWPTAGKVSETAVLVWLLLFCSSLTRGSNKLHLKGFFC